MSVTVDMSDEFGVLYHDISHLLVENYVFTNSHSVTRKAQPLRAKKSTVGVVQAVCPYMAMHAKPTCSRQAKCSNSPDEYVWGIVHPNTLKMDTCAMYMQSKLCDTAGVVLFENGDVFRGCIKVNCVNGAGVYYFVNGDSLHGVFAFGRPSGNMAYVWKNRDTCVLHYDNKTALCTSVLQVCLDDQVYKVISDTRSPSRLRVTLTLDHLLYLGISPEKISIRYTKPLLNTFEILFMTGRTPSSGSEFSHEILC